MPSWERRGEGLSLSAKNPLTRVLGTVTYKNLAGIAQALDGGKM